MTIQVEIRIIHVLTVIKSDNAGINHKHKSTKTTQAFRSHQNNYQKQKKIMVKCSEVKKLQWDDQKTTDWFVIQLGSLMSVDITQTWVWSCYSKLWRSLLALNILYFCSSFCWNFLITLSFPFGAASISIRAKKKKKKKKKNSCVCV